MDTRVGGGCMGKGGSGEAVELISAETCLRR